MSETTKLSSNDGFELGAYVARPAGEAIGGLVVIQEIFGVNKHIQSVADGYAKDGFLVVAPAIFDRAEKNVQLSYEGDDTKKAYDLMKKTEIPKALEDIQAALDFVRAQTGKKAGTIGYCLGGLLSWLSATRLNPDASVGYYAGGIGNFAEETPKAPVMLHFGRKDSHIPAEQGEKVKSLHPEVEVFWYDDADHAFNRDVGATYNPQAAKLARERSLAFLKKNLT
ncbi:Dienelactone hydrolase family [Acidisarcina polymorpha]|uniref:Dienelactone hydrolase family n=1 Tax=Acidisarcina polymorpha TaxID=2211140 RepID=A0A2Z5GA45_9BACT|nr:dienelactone hydrolase family protein [Acidisarcina polymorpha]AXC15899.1 Dienelactone hydrolase family [Acidisarcina polymorpha]